MATDKEKQSGGVSRERVQTILDMMRHGLFQEIQTETGQTVRINHGRKLDTLEQVDRAIQDYIDYMADINARRADGEKPYFCTISGFCTFCGISREAYYRYRDNVPAVRDRLKSMENAILQGLQQMGLNGDAATIPLMAELNNNHGYTNAPQVVRHEVIAELPTVDDIRRRLPVGE